MRTTAVLLLVFGLGVRVGWWLRLESLRHQARDYLAWWKGRSQ